MFHQFPAALIGPSSVSFIFSIRSLAIPQKTSEKMIHAIR